MVILDTSPWESGQVEAWVQPSPFGEQITVACTDRGVAFLEFGTRKEQVNRRFGVKNVVWVDRTIELHQVTRLHAWGTPFQELVWRTLLEIPKGQTRSYALVAQKIGRPKAARAVGAAVGRNPISVIVPCHRVVRADGTLGGYAWGAELKQRILDSERLL